MNLTYKNEDNIFENKKVLKLSNLLIFVIMQAPVSHFSADAKKF